jgi:hypothetical protein
MEDGFPNRLVERDGLQRSMPLASSHFSISARWLSSFCRRVLTRT